MAVIHEIQRYFNIVPLTGPRRVVRDTELEGYTIPKNTIVLISLYSVHMDPKIWGDPQEFRPERFITPDGKLNEALVDRMMPFGLGEHHNIKCIFVKNDRIFLCFVCQIHTRSLHGVVVVCTSRTF